MTAQTAYPHEAPVSQAASQLAARLGSLLPVLETARLRLRAPTLADFPAYAGILTSPRFIDGPMSREEAWFDFANYTASWLLRGTGIWAVETRADGTLVGFVLVGLEPGDRAPELGWMLTETAEGHGYATEAARAARDHAAALGLATLVSYIDPENTRSIALAERLGCLPDSAAAHPGEGPVLVYRHPAPDADGSPEAYA